MTRDLGVVDAVQGLLPEEATAVLAALTQLGDTWFLLLAVALVYWFRDRRTGAFALGTLLGGIALWIGLKALFGLPRPPLEVHLVAAHGNGFPSGHAVTATVGWGILALTVDAGTRRQRAIVAVAAVALVSFTRIALGVHFLVDVLAGIAVGAAYLAAVARLGAGRPTRTLGAAVLLSGAAVLVTGGGDSSLLLLGGSAGAAAAWVGVDVPDAPWGRGDLLPAAVGVAVLGGIVLLGYVFGVAGVGLLLGLVGGAGTVAIPALVGGGQRERRNVVRG